MSQRPARHARSRRPSAGGWSTPLSEPIELKDGTTLATLGEAAMFIADHPATQPRVGWNAAASGLLIASEAPTPENVRTATDRTRSALYFNRLTAP
jgi:hypothetical protein